MCANLVSKGNLSAPLQLFNRTVSKAGTLSEKIGHSVVAGTIADLVSKSDIIFYSFGDDQAVLDQVGIMLQTSVKDKILVDCSTVRPDTTRTEDEKIRNAGAEFVAMPVFGASPMADSGQLVCVLAGPKAAVAKIKPYCVGVMGRAVIDLSDQDPGKASLLKIIGNTFTLSMVTALSEGYSMAEKTGLGTLELQQFIDTMFSGPYTAYSNRMLSGDYYKRDEPLFGVDLALKDAKHARKLAEDAGMRHRIVEIAEGYLTQVKEHAGQKGDMAAIYGAKRQETGLKYENDK